MLHGDFSESAYCNVSFSVNVAFADETYVLVYEPSLLDLTHIDGGKMSGTFKCEAAIRSRETDRPRSILASFVHAVRAFFRHAWRVLTGDIKPWETRRTAIINIARSVALETARAKRIAHCLDDWVSRPLVSKLPCEEAPPGIRAFP